MKVSQKMRVTEEGAGIFGLLPFLQSAFLEKDK
jgi:hypothetical protein